ncbi:MAG: Rieske (2Fe-2S) protein [Bacteroidia bacterium]
MRWIKIPIPDQDIVQQITVDGKKICLIKSQGKVFAIQNNCPHAGGVLSDGWCREGKVVCPIHRWEYDLHTGFGSEGQGDYIHIYPLDFRNDGVYVGFKEKWWKRLLLINFFFSRR